MGCLEDMRGEIQSVLEVLKPLFVPIHKLRIAQISESAQRLPEELESMGYRLSYLDFSQKPSYCDLSIYADAERPYGTVTIHVRVHAEKFLGESVYPATLYRYLRFTLSGDGGEKCASAFKEAVEKALQNVFGERENWWECFSEVQVNEELVY